MQIFALVLLLVSAVILNLDAITGAAQEQQQEQDSEQCEDCSSNIKHTLSDLLFAEQNVAVLCVVAASMISGLSAALTQKVLQKKGTNSILVSAQLAVYGILFLTAKELLLNQATTAAEASSLLAGWDSWALLPVLTSALGGLVIGLVTQHAGSVMKGFALIIGLLVTGVAQWVVDGIGLKITDWVALGLVSISIYIHTSFPPPVVVNAKQKTT